MKKLFRRIQHQHLHLRIHHYHQYRLQQERQQHHHHQYHLQLQQEQQHHHHLQRRSAIHPNLKKNGHSIQCFLLSYENVKLIQLKLHVLFVMLNSRLQTVVLAMLIAIFKQKNIKNV